MKSQLTAWLQRHRSSTRLAYLLQLASRVISTGLSLLWTRWLLEAMGKSLYGSFVSFQAVAALGGLGDLGMGGAVGLRVGQHLGEKNEQALERFLAAARAVFLSLAVVGSLVFLALAPWLPQLLGFESVPGTGSLTLLFALAAPAVALMVLHSYVNNLNSAGLNLVWPILPPLVLGQLALLSHTLLARAQSPLWMQYTPYLVASVIGLGLGWLLLRRGCPELAHFRPLTMDWPLWQSLLARSWWVYLYGLGTYIYTTTDRLIINAGFGPEQVPLYQLNYKVCELAMFAVVTSSAVAMPKITQWFASPEPADRVRAIEEAERLNQFQAFTGCVAALVYLAGNDWFMRWWLGESMQAPVEWQIAFALNLAITTGTQTALDLTARVSDRGLRAGGIAIASTALLNLGLSLAAMKAGSILGIAAATVVAQLLRGWLVTRYTTQKLNLRPGVWLVRGALMPLGIVLLAGVARMHVAPVNAGNAVLLVGGYALLAGVAAVTLGITPDLIRKELAIVTGMFGRENGKK
ncbi:MAG: hypothetical protein AB1705_23760 [Verrucomicrobiota bacterium]